MPEKFIGRKKELQKLNELARTRTPKLVLIHGRPRMGKSRLIQEFVKKTANYTFSGSAACLTAAQQREEFARQIQSLLQIPLPRADDWSDLFWHVGQHIKKGKIFLILDEISFIGSKDPTFGEKLCQAWMEIFKQNPQLVLILCGTNTAWMDENIIKAPGFQDEIALNLQLEGPPLIECVQYLNTNSATSYDKFKILSVTGSVPGYLEKIIHEQNAEENIERMCFNSQGVLLDEFDQMFTPLFAGRSAIYKTILERLAEGPCELADIYEALKVQKSGVISEYMEELVKAGFVAQDFTWHLKTGEKSKLSHYRLKDNYVRFYFKFIRLNRSRIEQQGMKFHAEWQSAVGLHCFDNLVLGDRQKLQQVLGVDPSEIVNENPFFQSQTNERDGCQIDYMIQTRFGSCHLCEIEFSHFPLSMTIVQKTQQKMKDLMLPKNISIRPVLIHVNGVEEEVRKSGFYSAIINFAELISDAPRS